MKLNDGQQHILAEDFGHDQQAVSDGVLLAATLAHNLNSSIYRDEAFTEGFIRSLEREHRYLQGEVINLLLSLVCACVVLPTDQRNQGMVDVCKAVDQHLRDKIHIDMRSTHRRWKERRDATTHG